VNILHFCPRYAPARGGSENYVKTISERLAADGNEVTVVTTTAIDHDALYCEHLSHSLPGPEQLNGVDILRFPPDFHIEDPRIRKPCFHSTGMAHFVNSLERGRYDIVNAACLPFANMIAEARRAADTLGRALVVTPFLHTHPRLSAVYQTPRLISAVSLADRIVAQTEHEAEFLVRRWRIPRRRITVLGVGVDFRAVETRVQQAENASPFPTFVFLGTHDELKGTATVLDVSRRFDTDAVHFVFAGDMTQSFRSYMQHHGRALPDNAQLLGAVDERTKHDLLARMTCLVVPSAAESFGQVYLEAWMHKKPVIAARHGATACLIEDHRNGRLVEFGDLDGLEAAIRGYLEEPARARAHGRAGFKAAKAYDWSLLMPRLNRLYRETVVLH
jgi:glycosyltransferase involved in cell wall biosynthesis